MIKITDCTDVCYAKVMGVCVVLTSTECEGCRFYKPKNCEDWVRVGEYLYTPEEYEERRQNYGRE